MNNEPDYKDNLAFDPNSMPACDIEALKSQIKELKRKVKLLKETLLEANPEYEGWINKNFSEEE